MEELAIYASFDNAARVWVAEHDGLGLAAEAESMDVIVYKLQEMIPGRVELDSY